MPCTAFSIQGGARGGENLERAKRMYYRMMSFDRRDVPTAGKPAESGVDWTDEVMGVAR